MLQRALDGTGQPRRPATGAIIEPFTGAPQPWLDLVRVTVKVQSGLLCVTIRRAAPAPRNAGESYELRFAPVDEPAGSNVLLIGSVVLWLPDGNAPVEEAEVTRGYRERGPTISVAVRVADLVASYPLDLGERFRWRMRSASEFMLKGDTIVVTVDCAPQDAWISYPQGRRVDHRPGDDVDDMRCPRP